MSHPSSSPRLALDAGLDAYPVTPAGRRVMVSTAALLVAGAVLVNVAFVGLGSASTTRTC